MNERKRKEMLSNLFSLAINSRKVFCNEINIMHIPKKGLILKLFIVHGWLHYDSRDVKID